MTTTAHIKCHPDLLGPLPAGWTLGAHASCPGWSGYWATHEDSGTRAIPEERPDYDSDEDAGGASP